MDPAAGPSRDKDPVESSNSKSKLKAKVRPGPWPPRIEPFVPRAADHLNPRELKSWARRTGFNTYHSGETTATESDIFDRIEPVVESNHATKPEIEPVSGGRRRLGNEITAAGRDVNNISSDDINGRRKEEDKVVRIRDKWNEPAVVVRKNNEDSNGNVNVNGYGHGNVVAVRGEDEVKRDLEKGERELGPVGIDEFPGSLGPDDQPVYRSPDGLKIGVMENPGFVLAMMYGLQHYLSIAGSLVFIPLIMVPVMGGSDEETATVISTMLLVSGITTLLHSFFGSRLPLIQGSAFVFLAPALVIINSEEFRNLSENKFKHIMRELQGAVIVGSVFQAIMGYSGLMSLFLRLINPVVVAPTVAAIGLAFFSYGFPQAGTCAEISVPLIILILIFTLVPLSVAIIWAYAFFLTAGGAFNYKGCSPIVPSSNILLDDCKRHSNIMKHCRTDVSSAWKTAAWVRIPYPFQWGSPTFHFKTSLIMIFVFLVASVDSIGTYHATSLLVNLSPPTSAVVSRGIGLEGCSSILAGLWGTGTGSTTLTENIHTIDVTKMASRRPIEIGAAFMIFFSFVGKVGALLASMPLALAAAVLCFTWALVVALGLSTLQYTRTASPRNMIIVGFTLFISLSIPAYFQQYQQNSSLILPSYLVPYSAASDGPIHLGNKRINYALNALLSLNMVVALAVSFLLDNTVPGSRQERGAYIWSSSTFAGGEATFLEPYFLPRKIRQCFMWAKCVGA